MRSLNRQKIRAFIPVPHTCCGSFFCDHFGDGNLSAIPDPIPRLLGCDPALFLSAEGAVQNIDISSEAALPRSG
jgi:hypothetical protein